MERSRIPSLKGALKPLTIEIRSRANLLPFKALIYVTSNAVLKSPKASKARLKDQYKNLTNTIKILNTYADRLYGAGGPNPSAPGKPSPSEPDPYSMADTMKSAIDNYVSLFYSMATHERSAYVKSMSAVKHKLKRESNMLFIPAIFAEDNEDPKVVKAGLFKHLYSMPFKMLYNTSKSGLRLMLLQNGMALRSVNYEMVHEFSKSVSVLDARILEISEGRISPIKDEELKTNFIDQALKMSKETDINIAEIISDRVRTEGHIMREAHRLMRRAIHVHRN
ncbi:MAG: hypothetical protein KGH94_02410 [Candidatus Micrarchaeota archaeon]|nr:hypothetical protein [Candidatus Micrarchaeota archaeon]